PSLDAELRASSEATVVQVAQPSQSASQFQLGALRLLGERLDAPTTNHSYFVGSYLMRKTPPGAGWTKSPSPVLQGQSAEPTTAQRTATYQFTGRENVRVYEDSHNLRQQPLSGRKWQDST